MIVLGINGMTGQMGRTVVEAAAEREDVTVAFGIAPAEESESGRDSVDGVPVYEPAETEAAIAEHDPGVIIDFSVPAATVALAESCVAAGVPLVVGTTGIDEEQLSVLQEASEEIPLLKATNFSRGIQALRLALGPALEALPDYDVELVETHHNRKRDAPSGTARSILDDIADHREFETVYGRDGIQPREDGEVGVLVRRAGDVRGEHEVLLAGNDEVLTISHRAEDRGVFAAGAIDAAIWLTDRDPGQYAFGDVVAGEPTNG